MGNRQVASGLGNLWGGERKFKLNIPFVYDEVKVTLRKFSGTKGASVYGCVLDKDGREIKHKPGSLSSSQKDREVLKFHNMKGKTLQIVLKGRGMGNLDYKIKVKAYNK